VAFNAQGQWRKASWTGFQAWVAGQQKAMDQRMHLLRYKSALMRRRLTNLLKNLPPSFTDDVQKGSSFAVNGDDKQPPFQAEWKPRDAPQVGPSIMPPTKSAKDATGKPILAVKEYFYRELRGIEYVEHLIQKSRFEIEQIENENYWLECHKAKIARNLGIVANQWNDPEFRNSLIADDSMVFFSMLEHPPDILYQKMSEGTILMKAHLAEEGIVIPENVPNKSGFSDIVQDPRLSSADNNG